MASLFGNTRKDRSLMGLCRVSDIRGVVLQAHLTEEKGKVCFLLTAGAFGQ